MNATFDLDVGVVTAADVERLRESLAAHVDSDAVNYCKGSVEVVYREVRDPLKARVSIFYQLAFKASEFSRKLAANSRFLLALQAAMMEIGLSYCGTDGQIFTCEETSRTRLTKKAFPKRVHARDAGVFAEPGGFAPHQQRRRRATSRCPSSRRTHWSTRSLRSLRRRARVLCQHRRAGGRDGRRRFRTVFGKSRFGDAVFGDARRETRETHKKKRRGRTSPRLWRAQRCVSRSILGTDPSSPVWGS